MDHRALVASRMSLMDSSGIRKVFDLAKSLKDPINLSIGQPDFDVPATVCDAAIEAIRSGHNKYTVTQGIQELRDAALAVEKQQSGITHDSIFITNGVTAGVLLACMALLDPGDKVAIPDPYFVVYKHLSRIVGAEPIYVDTYPNFRVTADRLDAAGAAEAKVLFLNSPCNPTGMTAQQDDLKAIATWAGENNVFIVTDEIYRAFCYDSDFHSIAEHTDDVLLMNGFSKWPAMTGWRLSYCVGPAPIIAEMTKLQQFSFVCAPSMVQHAGIKALQEPSGPYVDAYRRKRDIIYEGLRNRFDIHRSSGAFYAFVRAPDGDGDAFCREALDRNLLIIPGSVFSEKKTHFRISFAAPDETLAKGVDVLNSMV